MTGAVGSVPPGAGKSGGAASGPASERSAHPSIVLLVVWFGTLPAYLDLWFASCAGNPNVLIRFITDQAVPFATPRNVVLHASSMDQVAERVAELVGGSHSVLYPYKLCDVRPMFAEIFPEYVEGFDFWGFADVDVIQGDLLHGLPPKVFSSHDKLLSRGHLQFWRNVPAVNNAFRHVVKGVDWRRVLRDPRPRAFDEWLGVSRILEDLGVAEYRGEVAADVDRYRRRLRLRHHPNHTTQAFTWSPGRLIRWYISATGTVEHEEFAYIHLQKRPMRRGDFPAGSPMFIEPDRFVPRQRHGAPSPDELREHNRSAPWEEVAHIARLGYRRKILPRLGRAAPSVRVLGG